MKANIEKRVVNHGQHLIDLFKLGNTDPVNLCRKLRRLEAKADRINTAYCNGDMTTEQHAIESGKITEAVKKIFNSDRFNAAFYYNSDPRGYSLKLRSEWTHENAPSLQTDWGGYGLLAPDLR